VLAWLQLESFPAPGHWLSQPLCLPLPLWVELVQILGELAQAGRAVAGRKACDVPDRPGGRGGGGYRLQAPICPQTILDCLMLALRSQPCRRQVAQKGFE